MGGTGDTGVTLLRAGWSRPPQTPPGWGRRPMGWTGMGGASPPTGAVPKIKAQGMGMGWAGAFLGQHKNPGVAYMCMYVYSTYSTPRGVCWDGEAWGQLISRPPSCWGQRWVLGTHWGRIGTHWGRIQPRGTQGGGSGGCGVIPAPPALPSSRKVPENQTG